MKRKEKGRVPTHWFTPQRPGPLHRQQRLNFFSCYLLHSSVHTKEKIEPGAEQVLQPWSSDMPSRNAKWCINPCTKYSPLHFPLYQSICKWDASAYGLLWRVSEILNLSAQISLKILLSPFVCYLVIFQFLWNHQTVDTSFYNSLTTVFKDVNLYIFLKHIFFIFIRGNFMD